MKLTKKRAKKIEEFDNSKKYELTEGSELLKKVNLASFDASVDLHVRLGVDPRQADQLVRGTVTLPHGTGKEKSVLVFCPPDKEKEAKEAGADYAGLDEFVEKVEGGWTEVDVVVAHPAVMPKIARLGKVLGPRNLMPNPKSGTVSDDIGKTVEEVKKGKISFRVDKFGIIHTPVGRISFEPKQIEENTREMIKALARMKPASSKGIYFRSITLASSMSPGISLDPKSIIAL